MNDMTLPGLGHNNPPGPIIPDPLQAKVADFTETAGIWLDLEKITSADQAAKATDFVAGAGEVWNELETERKAQKKPHDDAAKAVQELFALPQGKIKIAQERVKRLQGNWLKEERERERLARAERDAQARRDQEEADRQLAAAEARNDISGIVEAEAARKQAAKEVKAAAAPVKVQAGSATGAGRGASLRATWFADVQNINHAFVAYRDNREVRALLERLATADVRAQKGEKTAPQGFTLRKEENV